MRKLFLSFIVFIIFPLFINSQNWLPLDKGIGLSWASITHILVDSNYLYISGGFYEDGNGISMRGIAKWDGTKWDSVGNGNADIFNVQKFGLCKYANSLITSTTFYPMEDNLARLNGTTWDTIPNSRGIYANCFAEKDGVLFFGSSINKCGSDSTYGLGKFDGTNFSGLTPCYYPDNFNFLCMAFYQDTLYAGGGFYLNNIVPPNGGLAKWDGMNLLQVAPEFNPTLPNHNGYTIETMVVYNNELYVGGAFYKSQGFTGDCIMKWDGHHFTEVGMAGANQRVKCMKVYNNELYVGGWFTEIGGTVSKNIAKWDGNQWTTLNNDDFDDPMCINDICIYNDELYVAGTFRKIGNDTLRSIAKYNHPLASINKNALPDNSLNIYPNPCNDNQITISLSHAKFKEGTISIFNIIGEQISNSTFVAQEQIEMDVSKLAKGMYFVKISNAEGSLARKFVKE